MPLPSHLKYTKTHEWVQQEADGVLKVGITDHAQHLLGELVFVELPSVGKTFTQGTGTAVVESVKAASDVYMPVSGQVVEVNTRLADTPALVNRDPYGEGWIFKIKPESKESFSALLDAATYETHIRTEGDKS